MFNLITRSIRSPKHDVSTLVKVALPAVDGEDTNGNWKAVVDPNLSSHDILNVLLENWSDDEVKDHMFSRFIAVLADDPIRNDLIVFSKLHPDATQDELDAHSQAFADAGWNINLKHPATEKSAQSIEKKQVKAEQWVSEMTADAQAMFVAKLIAGNPDLADMLKEEKPKKK